MAVRHNEKNVGMQQSPP